MPVILIMDDDPMLCGNIALAMQTEGYETITASCCAEARKHFSEADLLLLDVMVPDGSGVALCKEIRMHSDVPVIFLTSCSEEREIVEGLDAGGDDYITKPFRLRELLSRVRAVLRRQIAAPAMPELTAVEQKLLDYLMCNREQYLTREQLLNHLWDSKGEFVNDNTLSVHISRLREKLRESGMGQIVTKRGMGYKWTKQNGS
ncbi:MAG: response regulator transcription factor [Eubacterium sp.]|nr:response regulator transcription factor [Eubacterium sp.]MBR1899362.1 response regulator transcription factor [Oscillospiraceae bacterium]